MNLSFTKVFVYLSVNLSYNRYSQSHLFPDPITYAARADIDTQRHDSDYSYRDRSTWHVVRDQVPSDHTHAGRGRGAGNSGFRWFSGAGAFGARTVAILVEGDGGSAPV